MPKVILKPLYHRGQQSIGIYFENNSLLNGIIRKQQNVKWSQSNKCWYLPLNADAYNKLHKALDGKATIDIFQLKQFLEKRKQVAVTVIAPPVAKAAKPITNTPAWKLSKENLIALEKFIEQLKLKSYSLSTIRTYRNEFIQLLQILKTSSVNELTPDDLKRYMVYAMEKEGIKENTAHSRLNALKFYFEQVLKREKFFWEIPRPKKPILLPNVLNEKEITNLFNAVTNLKHKAILFTAYSAGLRVSETVTLKISNIDSDRMQIKIEAAKGKKDRYAGLSPVLLDVLRSYLKNIKPKPVKYLFESEIAGEAYSARSAQKVFQRAKEKAGIRKDVSFHSLRHSFATHLLEKGIDIRFIKDLLGHFSIKTTERYVHVKKEHLVNITSPLDDLWLKGDIL
jgi:site-specific recombinase XerD